MLSSVGVRLFRNNVGTAFFRDANGKERPVKYGLGAGSSDLVGWTPVLVTKEMVGRHLAVFTALEHKSEGDRTTDEQDAFIAAVTRSGGIAGVFVDEREAKALVARGPFQLVDVKYEH